MTQPVSSYGPVAHLKYQTEYFRDYLEALYIALGQIHQWKPEFQRLLIRKLTEYEKDAKKIGGNFLVAFEAITPTLKQIMEESKATFEVIEKLQDAVQYLLKELDP